MKSFIRKSSFFILTVVVGFQLNAQDIDLVPGINYAYDPVNAQGIVEIEYVDVCNNGSDDATAFDVTMYFYDESTEDVYFIGTTRLDSGLSGNACISIENWSIDVTEDPSIPGGTYRLGIYVDSGEEIDETNENNNTGLLAGQNNYNPSTANISDLNLEDAINVYPNPATDYITVDLNVSNDETVLMEVYDISGRAVSSQANIASNGTVTIDVSTYESGVYIVKVNTSNGLLTRKVKVK